VDLKA
jgi:hypothetical protein